MLASGIVLGVVAGQLLGGRLGRLAEIRVQWWPLLLIAVVVRVVAPYAGESPILWDITFVAIAAVAVSNRGLPGMWSIALGASLNLLVVLVNGAMPVDGALARSISVDIPADGLHRELRDTDLLTFLADRIPVAPIHRIYSVGDVMLALGGFWVPFARMRSR